MGKGSEPRKLGQDYDLRYISRLTPGEIGTRLAEKTVPYHPRKVNSNPLLLHPQQNGDFYLVFTGYHYLVEACGIALLHLEPQSDSGDTVIEGIWKKKVIAHFTAPKYRVEEQKRLQTFIETNLLE